MAGLKDCGGIGDCTAPSDQSLTCQKGDGRRDGRVSLGSLHGLHPLKPQVPLLRPETLTGASGEAQNTPRSRED